MIYTIYKITNKINGKFYIGKHQTKDLNDGYMGSGKLIRRAIKKHGIENFTKEIIHTFDNEQDMNVKEKELVVLSEQSYNLCNGGQGGFSYINRNPDLFLTQKRLDALTKVSDRTQEQIDKWKRSLEKRDSPVTRQKISDGVKRARLEGRIGSKQLQSSKAKENRLKKMKEINHQQGSKNSQYGTCWVTNGQENKKIKKEELDSWLEKGYNKGRKLNASLA